MFQLYRNQSLDLLCKSTDWFPYDGNNGRERVKTERKLLNVEHRLRSFLADATAIRK